MLILKVCLLLICQTSDLRVYFFTSPHCPPCHQMEPVVDRLASEGYPIQKVDVNAQPALANQFKIRATPTTVIVSGNEIVGQQPGLIGYGPLRQRLDQLQAEQPAANGPQPTYHDEAAPRGPSANRSVPSGNTASVRESTTEPNPNVGSAEQHAMQATVRLRVVDREGASFATGTVIHSSGEDVLILTCGHVFRESKGNGEIKIDVGFGQSSLRTVSGQLIDYNSDAYDIALVTCKPEIAMNPVEIAPAEFQLARNAAVFSIGCNSGDDPTIRHSRFKKVTTYDGVNKFDVVGRPVNGRSGGGLFSSDGKLIGVCNAAAVNVDEGIYTAITSIYWQLNRVNLTHLFNDPQGTPSKQAIASTQSNGPQEVAIPITPATNNAAPEQNRTLDTLVHEPVRQVNHEQAIPASQFDREIIIIVRDKNNLNQAETVLISNPSDELLQVIATAQMKSNSGSFGPRDSQSQSHPVVATLPKRIPNLPPRNQVYPETMRAQSPQ